MEYINVYTDGSASVAGANAGKAGFGVYFPDLRGSKRGFSLGFVNGKTGQMEVCALLFALRAMLLKSETPILLRVYSDSEYVVKTFTENRLEKWIKNGWYNSSGEVANKELWMLIREALLLRPFLTLEMIHIKSHQLEKEKDPLKKSLLLENPNIIGNSIADKLADYKRHSHLLNSIRDIKHKKSVY